jgi:hypothetical protein
MNITKLALTLCLFICTQTITTQTIVEKNNNSINKIQIFLSAFGVESDGFPEIYATIDLQNDTSLCSVSYYDPHFHDTTYRLSSFDMLGIKNILDSCDIKKLQTNYKVDYTDQPTATSIFFFNNQEIKISDYGLRGDCPLTKLYDIVFKLETTFRHLPPKKKH